MSPRPRCSRAENRPAEAARWRPERSPRCGRITNWPRRLATAGSLSGVLATPSGTVLRRSALSCSAGRSRAGTDRRSRPYVAPAARAAPGGSGRRGMYKGDAGSCRSAESRRGGDAGRGHERAIPAETRWSPSEPIANRGDAGDPLGTHSRNVPQRSRLERPAASSSEAAPPRSSPRTSPARAIAVTLPAHLSASLRVP